MSHAVVDVCQRCGVPSLNDLCHRCNASLTEAQVLEELKKGAVLQEISYYSGDPKVSQDYIYEVALITEHDYYNVHPDVMNGIVCAGLLEHNETYWGSYWDVYTLRGVDASTVLRQTYYREPVTDTPLAPMADVIF